MRIHKNQFIAGTPASIAREVVRHFREPRVAQIVSQAFGGSESEAHAALSRLADAGFVRRYLEASDGNTWWVNTIDGNALTMASFARPITRNTAERLLKGIVERAHIYNSEPSRILYVSRLRVFGSYLIPEVERLGDLDLEIVIGRRVESPGASHDYAIASGRHFSTFLEELGWPETELLRILRNRSSAINLTRGDVSEFTDRHEVVYAIEDDLTAIPAPR